MHREGSDAKEKGVQCGERRVQKTDGRMRRYEHSNHPTPRRADEGEQAGQHTHKPHTTTPRTLSFSLTSAPAATNAVTIGTYPLSAAK